MQKIISTATAFINYIISPSFCAYCRAFFPLTFQPVTAYVCAACIACIKPVVSIQLEVTKSVTISVFAIADYSEPLKNLILAKHWSDRRSSQALGTLIWEHTYVSYLPCDYLVPIPLHWTRYAQRGYNQAEIIASVLAQKKGCTMLNVLQRMRRTALQSTLTFDDRKKNLKDVFDLNPAYAELIRDKHIMLVDDLMTTGSTLQAAVKALLPYKPKSISAVVACRVI